LTRSADHSDRGERRTGEGLIAVLADAAEVVLDPDGERAREVALLDRVAFALPALTCEVGVGVEDHGRARER